ncbi:hypothetical protein M758_7G003800 [Ceratodon purpureus]|nr:hypothetical protein M758_7G003800 [Ceratodon purpureus]
MADSLATESPDETPILSPRTTRGGSIVTQKQRWPSVRASAARKSGLSLSKGTKSSVNGGPASSRKSRAKGPPMGELKIRSVSGVQTFFKERTLSKADAYIRDRTASEGHIFLKALAPDAPFLDCRFSRGNHPFQRNRHPHRSLMRVFWMKSWQGLIRKPKILKRPAS